jgi:hypothetical protein
MTSPDPHANGSEHVPPTQHALVRPYMLTRGRTTSSLGVFELHAPARALVTPEQLGRGATPEDRRIVELCQTPISSSPTRRVSGSEPMRPGWSRRRARSASCS